MWANQIESSVDRSTRDEHTNVKDRWGCQCPGSYLVMKICGQMFTTVNSCKTTAKQVKLSVYKCSRLTYTLHWHSKVVFMQRERCIFHTALSYQVISNLLQMWAWHSTCRISFSCAWYIGNYIPNLRSLAIVIAKIFAFIQTKMRIMLV